jgi:hypothetical protein
MPNPRLRTSHCRCRARTCCPSSTRGGRRCRCTRTPPGRKSARPCTPPRSHKCRHRLPNSHRPRPRTRGTLPRRFRTRGWTRLRTRSLDSIPPRTRSQCKCTCRRRTPGPARTAARFRTCMSRPCTSRTSRHRTPGRRLRSPRSWTCWSASCTSCPGSTPLGKRLRRRRTSRRRTPDPRCTAPRSRTGRYPRWSIHRTSWHRTLCTPPRLSRTPSMTARCTSGPSSSPCRKSACTPSMHLRRSSPPRGSWRTRCRRCRRPHPHCRAGRHFPRSNRMGTKGDRIRTPRSGIAGRTRTLAPRRIRTRRPASIRRPCQIDSCRTRYPVVHKSLPTAACTPIRCSNRQGRRSRRRRKRCWSNAVPGCRRRSSRIDKLRSTSSCRPRSHRRSRTKSRWPRNWRSRPACRSRPHRSSRNMTLHRRRRARRRTAGRRHKRSDRRKCTLLGESSRRQSRRRRRMRARTCRTSTRSAASCTWPRCSNHPGTCSCCTLRPCSCRPPGTEHRPDPTCRMRSPRCQPRTWSRCSIRRCKRPHRRCSARTRNAGPIHMSGRCRTDSLPWCRTRRSSSDHSQRRCTRPRCTGGPAGTVHHRHSWARAGRCNSDCRPRTKSPGGTSRRRRK